MALARSASGPGGLSINTSSANNLFGQNSNQTPAAGGLFGSSQAQPAQPSSLFGNAGAAASTPKPGGLFGSTAAAPSQPQQSGGGLFGNTGTQQQTGASGGGLFGAAGTAQQQPAQQAGGGGLFGATGAQQQPAQPAGGGLFGAASNTASQPQQSGGLFGATNNANTQASQPAGGGLFGAAAAQPQNQGQASGGLFGGGAFGKPQQQQQQPQQGSSLFGQPAQPKAGLFGSTINGQQSTMGSIPGLTMGQGQSQSTLPGSKTEMASVRGTTRFNDLADDVQKDILDLDKQIQNFMTQKAELDAFMPGHGEMLEHIPDDVKFVERKYGGVQSALESDAEAIEGVRLYVEQDAANAKLSFRAIDNLKLPQQYHTGGLWSTRQQSTSTANTETDGQGLVGFFNKTADDMDGQLRVYERQLTEIEMHMRGVQDNVLERLQQMMAAKNNGPSPADQQLADLGAVLRDFEMGILRVAGDVGAAKEGMARLQLGEFMNASEQHGAY